MTDFNESNKHLLSSFLDQELEQDTAAQAEDLVQNQLASHVKYRNFKTVKKACAEMSVLQNPEKQDDFLGGIFAQIEQLEPDNPAHDLECLSAWVDGEFVLTEEDLSASDIAEPYAQQTRIMTAALQALPVPELSADFTEKVMAHIEPFEQDAFAPIAEALQALSVPDVSAHFADKVMARIEAIDTISEQDAFAPIAEALQALPVPEPSADFVARVMLATESLGSEQKARLFALPMLWQSKWGQRVAAVAVFGLLLLASQNLLQSSQSTVVQIPSDHIVQVEYAPESELFEDVMNTSLENTSSDDITLLIGG